MSKVGLTALVYAGGIATTSNLAYKVPLLIDENVTDSFRLLLGSHWAKRKGEGPQLYSSAVAHEIFKDLSFDSVDSDSPNRIKATGNTKYLFFQGANGFDHHKFIEFLKKLKTFEGSHKDYAFEYLLPFDRFEVKKLELDVTHGLMADVESDYNFYQARYENGLTKLDKSYDINERILPNVHLLALSQTEAGKEEAVRLLTFSKDAEENVDFGAESLFDNFRRHYLRAIKKGGDELIYSAKKQEIYAFSTRDYEVLERGQSFKEMVPMSVEINFGTDKPGSVSAALIASGMEDSLLNELMTATFGGNIAGQSSRQQYASTEEENGEFGFLRYPSFDFNVWLSHFRENKIADLRENAVYFGGLEKRFTLSSKPEYRLHKMMSYLIFEQKLKDIVEQYQRSLQDVFAGKKAYSETLAYKVIKRNKTSGTILQTFFFMNKDDADNVRYIDSQVRLGEEYEYTVYALNLVMGSEYEYEQSKAVPAESGRTTADVEATFNFETTLRVIQVPYYKQSTIMLSDPPALTQTKFVPFKDVDNKLRMILTQNTDSYRDFPVILDVRDKAFFRQMLEKQRSVDGKIQFESDDPVEKFRVYRLTERPDSFKDFEKLSEDVHKTVPVEKGSTSAIFDDDLEPNTKYYYMFRTIDIHGYLSNPSAIYEVELVNDSGNIYFVLRAIEVTNKKDKQSSKNMRKFIKIEPSHLQVLVNEKESVFKEEDLKGELVLGYSEEKVWDRWFRICLTSKSTGKKIYTYVKFTYDGELVIKNA